MKSNNYKPGGVPLELEISLDARKRFEELHKSLGFESEAKTFEAIVYLVSTEEKNDVELLKKINKKLDRLLEYFEEPK